MTNGEKLKEIFPNGVLTSINNSYYWGDDILISKNWWNAEYIEPNCSEIPTGSDNLSSGTRKKLETGTTKNDLGVDCIVDVLGSYTDLDILYKREIAENILTKLSSVTPIR